MDGRERFLSGRYCSAARCADPDHCADCRRSATLADRAVEGDDDGPSRRIAALLQGVAVSIHEVGRNRAYGNYTGFQSPE